MNKEKADDEKICTTAFLLTQSMNNKELFKLCVLLLKVLFEEEEK